MVEVSKTADPQSNLKVLVYLNTSEPPVKRSSTFKDLFASQEGSDDLSVSNLLSNPRMGADHEKDFQLLEVEIESFTIKMLYQFVQEKKSNDQSKFELEIFQLIIEVSEKTLH